MRPDEDVRPPHGQPRTQFWWCNLIHIFNDGYITSLSLLLPFIAVDLDLNYTQSGFLKSAINGAISVAQIPAGLLSERDPGALRHEDALRKLLAAPADGNAWWQFGLMAFNNR